MNVLCLIVLVVTFVTLSECKRGRPGDHNINLNDEDLSDLMMDHPRFHNHDFHHHDYHGHSHHARPIYHIHNHDSSSSSSSSSSQESSESSDSREKRHEEHTDDRVYRFQVGDNFGAYEYLDENGVLNGFYVDLILAVCRKAEKKCAYLLDAYDHCWKTSGEMEYPGVGMMDGWYDGCVGMLPSPDRLNTFNFTMAFTPNVKAALHWRAADDMGDKKNLTGRKIGFIEGWAVSQRCLKRQFNIPGTNSFEPLTFQTHEELVAALLSNQVDAILTVDVFNSAKLGIVPEEPWFQCTLRGLSVMTHYQSDVTNWWNDAFLEMHRNGEFRKLCNDAKQKHGHRGDVNCIDL